VTFLWKFWGVWWLGIRGFNKWGFSFEKRWMWLFSALIDPLKYSFFPNTLPPPLWFNFLGEKGPMNNAYPGCDGDLADCRILGVYVFGVEDSPGLTVWLEYGNGRQISCCCVGGYHNDQVNRWFVAVWLAGHFLWRQSLISFILDIKRPSAQGFVLGFKLLSPLLLCSLNLSFLRKKNALFFHFLFTLAFYSSSLLRSSQFLVLA